MSDKNIRSLLKLSIHQSPICKGLAHQRIWFIFMLTGQADRHTDKQTKKMDKKTDKKRHIDRCTARHSDPNYARTTTPTNHKN